VAHTFPDHDDDRPAGASVHAAPPRHDEGSAAAHGVAAPAAEAAVNAIRGPSSASGMPRSADIEWLDLDAVADVAIVAGGRRAARVAGAWSADCPGEQTIEIRFHQPTSLRRLRVVSSEDEQARTQEMTIWASVHRGERHSEVLRQQFNFSPSGATEEVEEYALQLDDVSAIQLRIVPSIDGRPAVARVRELRLESV
jgi:hypothetical protein